MTIPRSLLVAGTILSLTLLAPAELPAEARIEHLEQAARHLAEVGMADQAADLRTEANEIRRDLRQGQIAELAAMIQRLRQQNHTLQERIAQLEARAQAPGNDAQAAQPEPDLDQLAAEAHRKQTEETWAAIKRAAREGLPPAPEIAPEPPAPEPPAAVPQAKPTPPKPAPAKKVAPLAAQDRALLEKILQSLQRIEQKMAQ